MEFPIDSMKEAYNTYLKAKDYNKKFNGILHQIRGNFEFILQFLYDVIHSERFSGSKVLEIGSGATVHNIASASSKFSCIVQSDYVLDNCEELRRWHQGQSTLDWSQFLEIVLTLEQKHEERMNLGDLENRIRNTVKAVVRGDLLSDSIFIDDELSAETSPPYDLVISVLAIETVAPDLEEYVAILQRIKKLLRPGGGLIICGYENGSPWLVDGKYFHHVKLSLEQITDALKRTGYGNCHMKNRLKTKSEYVYEYDSLFCVAAEKL